MKKETTFSNRLSKEIKPFMLMVENDKVLKKGLGERIVAHLMGDGVPGDDLPLYNFSQKEKYIRNVFDKYYEIRKSLDIINLSKNFLSKLPNKNSKVSKIEYIKYHYEHYLNEIYITNLRFNQLLDYIIKICLKQNLSFEIKEVKKIKLIINKGMMMIVDRRGLHVHKKKIHER